MVQTKENGSRHSSQEQKRHSKPWRLGYAIPATVRQELLEAIISSKLIEPLTNTTMLSSRKGEKESRSNFTERIRQSTIVPTQEQIDDFTRHGLTTVGVPLVVQGVEFIDLSPLAGARDPQGIPQTPKFIWHYRRRTKGEKELESESGDQGGSSFAKASEDSQKFIYDARGEKIFIKDEESKSESKVKSEGIDDEFAKAIGAKDLAHLREIVKKDLEQIVGDQVEAKLEEEIFEEVLKIAEVLA